MARARYIDIVERLSAKRRLLAAPIRLPDEHTLATEHHVARDTIRRALKVLEEQEAVVRRRRRGTFLQPLVAGPSACRGQAIGFVPPWWADSTTAWYTSTVFEGISRWADEQACSLSVLHARRQNEPVDEDDWMQRVRERNLAGLIWLHPQSHQVPLLRRVAKCLPTVVVGRHIRGTGVYSVTPDYDQAALLIDEHLVGLGHTTYAMVGTDLLGIYSRTWIEAVGKAHARRNVQFDHTTQFLDIRPFPRDQLPHLLLDLYLPPRPEVQALVLTSSSYLAYLASDARFRERVGRDLSVVTIDFGQYPMESCWPGRSIDHIVCDWQGIGRQAIATLGQLIEGEVVPELRTTPVHREAGQTSTQYQVPDHQADACGPDQI